MENTYNQKVVLRDKEINCRKWKGKDRKKFIQAINDENEDAALPLVYDCLEDKNIVLNTDEFRFLLTKLRSLSINNIVSFNFTCGKCKKEFSKGLDLNNLIRQEFVPFSTIEVNDIKIEIGPVRNKKSYDEKIKSQENAADKFFIDFLYHVQKLNGKDTFTFDELIDYFDNLDTDILDEIFDIWEKMKFKVQDKNTVECVNCNFKEDYIFDDIPDFFPGNWFRT